MVGRLLAGRALSGADRAALSRIALALVLVPQLLIDAVVWQHPRTLWPVASAINPALEYLGPLGRAYAELLPMLRGGIN
jgi:hypothetical protein